jgi:predicted metal-dependent peptidase
MIQDFASMIPGDPVRVKVRNALRLVCASMPHLAGLANAVRVYIDDRVPTAAITQSGRLLVNPRWFGSLTFSEAAFIAAHELFHLCLETHERGIGTNDEVFNYAHDYVINDILKNEMGCEIPQRGLVFPGARMLSAEKISAMLNQGQLPGPKMAPKSAMTKALEDAGLLPNLPPDLGPGNGDVLTREMERRLFPDSDSPHEERMRQRMKSLAAKANSLGMLNKRLGDLPDAPAPPQTKEAGDDVAVADALRSAYQPPWELALQQWMEAVAPGPRTYMRPSRRDSGDPRVVLAGRKRVGWAMHIVLDTSGSMVSEIPRILGVVASFCEAVGVGAIHVLQCDVRVTKDEWVDPEELQRYTVAGFGSSDMTPAMLRLADDPEVEAALVVTDGYIEYPQSPMPYQLLWVLTEPKPPDSFTPHYGHIICLPHPVREEEEDSSWMRR